MLVVALFFAMQVSAWTRTSQLDHACRLSTRRQYSSTQLRKRCPGAFKCPNGLVNGQSKDDYNKCASNECFCLSVEKQLQDARREGKSRVIIQGCSETSTQIGIACNYMMPKGCSVKRSKCGTVYTFIPSDCQPLNAQCRG